MKTWKIVVAALILFWWFAPAGLDLETLMGTGIALLFVAAGVLAVFGAVTTYRRSRYVEDLPTTTIRAASTGLNEFKGRVVPAEETLTSPFAERECVLCQYVIGEPPPDDPDRQSSPYPSDYALAGVPFYVEDDSGRVLVHPNGADVRIPRNLLTLNEELNDRGDPFDGAPYENARLVYGEAAAEEPPVATFAGRRESWLEEYGLIDRLHGMRGIAKTLGTSDQREIPSGTVRYAETRLEEGDEVYVLGTARPLSANGREEDEDDVGLTVSAPPESNRSSSPVGSYLADLFSVEDYLRLDTDYRSIFLISSEDEENLVSGWRSKMWIQLVGGFFVFVIGLVITLVALRSVTV